MLFHTFHAATSVQEWRKKASHIYPIYTLFLAGNDKIVEKLAPHHQYRG
jgi:hypothetical protein